MAKQTHEQAKAALEAALTNYMRFNRDDDNNQLFIQDYVILLASESMEPGKENITYHDCINRSMMAKYSIVGLLHSGLGYYNGCSHNE
jgi:hypothetical protein